jgi:hypothetical protein
MAHEVVAIDEVAIPPFLASRRRLPNTEHDGAGAPGTIDDEERIQHWLDELRAGSEVQQLTARRGLATMFERRGMYSEAIELLEPGIEPGVRGAATLRWLSRLYQAQEDEVGSLEAAVRAWPAPVEETLEVPAPPRPRASSRLLPILLMFVAVGSIVGASLGLIMSLLKP